MAGPVPVSGPPPVQPHLENPSVTVQATGDPPSTFPRDGLKKSEKTSLSSGTKLLLSLIVLAPRLAIGAAYLTSATVKGVVAGLAIAGAKSGVFRGKTDDAKNLASASFKDARRDMSKAILLAVAGILAPLGHLQAVWDKGENWGKATESTGFNIGSKSTKMFVWQWGAILVQDALRGDRLRDGGYEEPPANPHKWKKIEGKLDSIADVLTQYKGMHKAMNKFREKHNLELRPPLSPEGGP